MLPRLLLLLVLLVLSGCGPEHRYQRSPQWDKDRDHFENPKQWPPFPTIRDFFRWVLGRRPPVRPRGFVPPQVKNDGARLRANRSVPTITWIGHASLLVQAGGLSILTDPVFSRRIGLFRRLAPPGLVPAALPPIDAVLISHNHRDHLDEDSVRALPKDTRFVVPLGLAAWFRDRGRVNVTELDWWQSVPLGAATITLVPAQHWSRRGLTDENRSLWGGYVIDAGGARVYFAGDSGYPAAFAEIGRRFPGIRYALLPIGAYEPRWFMRPQHMNPEDAAQAFRDLGARCLLPMHFSTFNLSDEPLDEPPRRLRAALADAPARLVLLRIGETCWDGEGACAACGDLW